jgi:hypothetical protein
MDLTLDEQRLIIEFRKLPPSGREELLKYAATLLHRADTGEQQESEPSDNQCRIKNPSPHPEAEKTPFFTE